MYDQYRYLRPKERPRSLGMWPDGTALAWHNFRWLLLLFLPPCASAIGGYCLENLSIAAAIFIFLAGSLSAVVLFTQLHYGVTSSNHGTYFRNREPVRFFIDVIITSAMYLLLSAQGWFMHMR